MMANPLGSSGPPPWVQKFFEEVNQDGTRGATLRTIARWFRFLFSLGPVDPEHKPVATFQEVITLQTIVVVQVAGLLAYVQGEAAVEGAVVVTYLGLFSVPFIGLIFVVWSYQTVDGRKRFVYSAPARRYGSAALLLSAVIAPTTTYYYWTRGLPGQGEAKLVEVHEISVIQTGEKVTATEFSLVLSDDAVARPWKVTISLTGKSAEHWKIQQVRGFLDRTRNEMWKALGRSDPEDEPTQNDALWIGTIASAKPGNYWVQVVLDPKHAAADDRGYFATDDLTIEVVPQ